MPKIVNAKLGGILHTLVVEDGKFSEITKQDKSVNVSGGHDIASVGVGELARDLVIDAGGRRIVPAGIDPHVHSRDPGFPQKETWSSLARASYRGGVVAVCDMPNTCPSTIDKETVLQKAKLAEQSGLDFGIFLGVSSKNINAIGEILSDRSLPICGLKVYYGKSTGDLVFSRLEKLQKALPGSFDKPIVFHSEDQELIDKNGLDLKEEVEKASSNEEFALHSKVRSSEAALSSTKVILDWAVDYGRPVHFAHVSTPEEARLISAKAKEGAAVTMEVAPHHLIFSTDDYKEKGSLIKMNPPVRSLAEVKELRELVGQGLFDCFGTDHAPHTLAEKEVALSKCPSGIPSIELFWPLVDKICELTNLSDAKAVSMATSLPAGMFGFLGKGDLSVGASADFVCLEAKSKNVIREEIISKCGWSPYEGLQLPSTVIATWHRGRCVYSN